MNDEYSTSATDVKLSKNGISTPTKVRGLSKNVTVTCNITAGQWELYSGVGRDGVAAELSAAFAAAVNGGGSCSEVYSAVEKVMLKYRDFGAIDSEPIRMLEQMLSEVFD